MAFKVNYNQQRAERDRAKAAKKEAKLRDQEELTARRKAGLDTPGSEGQDPEISGDTPAEPEAGPSTGRTDGAS
jgi:hypothetical protein